MGWVSDFIDSAQKNPIKAIAKTNPITAPFAGMIPDNDSQAPQAAQEDPRLTEQRKKMMGEAKEFRANLPKYTGERYAQAAQLGQETLQDTTKNIKQNANRRGLLFSGMRQGQEASARGRMASMLAGQRAEINREAQDLAGAKEEAAAQTGLAGFGDAIQRSDNLYKQALDQEMARRKNMAQLGQGVGYGLGAYYGSKPTTQEG
jgi:class 3 adenylate cyclase